MCRLLGLVANKPVNFKFSLERFREFASRNRDGWGVGWYCEKNKEPLIEKEAKEATISEKYTSTFHVNSCIFIAHVRYKTFGEPKVENTHPFAFKNWLFAHNGSICEQDELYLAESLVELLKGDTDSEKLFLYLIQDINNESEINQIIDSLVNRITELKKFKYSSLNFILSNGEYLIAYRDAISNLDYYSLYYLKRDYDSPAISYLSPETKALIDLKLARDEKAIIVCSEKLTRDEEWKCLSNGEMLVGHAGDLDCRIIKWK